MPAQYERIARAAGNANIDQKHTLNNQLLRMKYWKCHFTFKYCGFFDQGKSA
jgi:hypothetical protein